MKTSIERLWNCASLALWSEPAYYATLMMATGSSILLAARYLHSFDVPLSVARMILLGV